LALLGLVILDEKKILKPWIYKLFKPFARTIIQYILKLLDLLFQPWIRIAITGYLLWLINIHESSLLFSILLMMISITLLWKPRIYITKNPAPDRSDGFEELDSDIWQTQTGQPIVENNFGKPSPGLGLPVATPAEATNSFLILKDSEFERGIVECDFYLEPGAVFNIIFFCDLDNNNWYMARYDSRSAGSSDGFLIKDRGRGVNWRFHSMSGTHTSEKQWHRARIEFTSEKVTMYKDGELVTGFNPTEVFGKQIGFFNEVQHVHVDNFYITKNI
jgi:hypothetical protein